MIVLLSETEARDRKAYGAHWAPSGSEVVLVADGTCPDEGEDRVFLLAVDVGAEHVVFLPDAEPWLLQRVAALRATEPEGLSCLDHRDPSECRGPVEYRTPLSSTGKSFPRCESAWEARLEVQDGINKRYPKQPPPGWSPLDAGESWDED